MTNHKKAKIEQIHKDEAQRLKSLFANRPYPQLSQGRFGEEFDIGSQGVVWQYLNARIPLNVEAAVKFAKGLRCSIAEFSPRLSRELETLAHDSNALHKSHADQNERRLDDLEWGLSSSLDLKENLKAEMDARGVNPHSLAAISQVPQPTIHRILTGTSAQPRRSNVEKLAAALGVTVESLYSKSASEDATKPGEPPPSLLVLDEFHRTKAEPVTDAIEKVLQIAGLGLDVLGGRTGLTATLANALRAQAETTSKNGMNEWSLNDPSAAGKKPFFSRTKTAKKENDGQA